MNTETMLSLVRKLHRIWNQGDIDAIPSVYSQEFIGHGPKGWQIGDSRGHEGTGTAIFRIRTVFPDWNEEILDLIVSTDRVVSRYLSTGTHHGEFSGIAPTGREVKFEEISIYRIADNRIEEQWCLADDLLCSRQLTGAQTRFSRTRPALQGATAVAVKTGHLSSAIRPRRRA